MEQGVLIHIVKKNYGIIRDDLDGFDGISLYRDPLIHSRNFRKTRSGSVLFQKPDPDLQGTRIKKCAENNL